MDRLNIVDRRLRSFERIWEGGYFGGDPLEPTHAREYGDLSLISVNHAVYKALVRPNIHDSTTVLEIGPGRGAWSRCMLDAKELWCLDALSAEHNCFWDYVGREQKERVKYFQVKDASLDECPDSYFDFIFSFGAFCHMPIEIQRDYQRNLFRKARPGAHGAIMFADYEKFNGAWNSLRKLRTVSLTPRGVSTSIRFNIGRLLNRIRNVKTLLDNNDHAERPGRFFHGGIKETAEYMASVGWTVISADIGLNLRDPIVYFERPRD